MRRVEGCVQFQNAENFINKIVELSKTRKYLFIAGKKDHDA